MKRFSSGSEFESRLVYSRSVVCNGFVFVSATAATGADGQVINKGDVYGQVKTIFQKLTTVLQEAGTGMDRVVQTRLYVTDITDWPAVGRAHAETFPTNRPVMSLIHVRPFLDPEMLVEVELVAYVG